METEMQFIADHLAGIPGRKNLIWMANQFPISGATLRKFINADVAIYTVDEAGVKGSGAPSFIAGLTGRVNYAKRNDLDIAVREAVADGHASYILGFYPPGDDPNPFGGDLPTNAVHQITVHVSRPGVSLRYRMSYQNETTSSRHTTTPHDLVEALNRPVDATAIGITASVSRTKDRLHLTEMVDVAGLDLELDQGIWKGRAELVARFLSAEGTWVGPVEAETATLTLKPVTYESALLVLPRPRLLFAGNRRGSFKKRW
jgi:hypothetical protein